LEKITQMVTSQFLIICFLSFLSFSLGRVVGKLEASAIFSRRMNDIVGALKKVEQLAELRGEDLTKLSSQEIVNRTQKQLEIKDNE